MDELRLLRHFEAVYRLSSFSGAAAELRLTHSALTKSIKTLETNWETQLFYRTTRAVVATEASKKLYPKAVELLAFAANVRSSVSAEEAELNILCGVGVIETTIHPAILRFARTYPKTRINVDTMPPHLAAQELEQRRAHALVYHETSFAFMPQKERMSFVKMIDEPYWIIHRKGGSIKPHSLSLEDLLLRYDWSLGVSRTFEESLPEELRRLVKKCGVPRYRLVSQSAIIELVKQSEILSALPRSAAEALVARGEVSALPLPGDFRFAIGVAVLKEASRDPTLEHFIECLQGT